MLYDCWLFLFLDSITSLQRRNSSNSIGKENTIPPASILMPPPDLSEETLMAPEHNEIVAKLKFISMLVDTIIDVARCKAAPLSAITESVSPRNSPAAQGGLDASSPHHRKLQQLLLYMRCLHLLSQTLDFSRAELKSKKLKPSTSVKNGKHNYQKVFIPLHLYRHQWLLHQSFLSF